MCQFSGPDVEDNTSVIAQAMTSPAKQLSQRRSASSPPIKVASTASSKSSPPEDPAARGHTVCEWWRDTLCNTANGLNAQAASFSSHLESLSNARRRMRRLASKCTQARLYPNPASANSRSALKTQLDTLVADMDYATRLHEMYFAALSMYIVAVHTVIDSLSLSDEKFHRPDCAHHIKQWTSNTRTKVRLEAEGLMDKLHNMHNTFKKLGKDVLMKWERNGKGDLDRMINALPEQADLKNKAAVRKYFPRQVREIEDAEKRTVRKPTIVGGMVCETEAECDVEECGAGRESKPKVDVWSKLV